MFPAEAGDELDTRIRGRAGRGIQDQNLDSLGLHKREGFNARCVFRIADYDARDSKLHDRTGAHETRLQSSVQGGVVSVDAFGGAQGRHLTVQNGIAFLDQCVMTLAQNLTRVVRYKEATDRAAAFLITLSSLFESPPHISFVVEFHATTSFGAILRS